MREIAIVFCSYEGCSECGYRLIPTITEWSKVSEEDFKIIKEGSRKSIQQDCYEHYIIIEKPTFEQQEAFIRKTVQDYVEHEKTEAIRREKEKAEREAKKQTRELKKRAKTEAQEKALLEELEKKYKQ